MKTYELPSELGAIDSYLHPLALKEKWALSYEELADLTGADITTLRRYSFPNYSKNARRPYKNKPLLILCHLLDEIEACFEVFSHNTLPSELGAIDSYLHPLALKEKWALSYEQLADITGADITTLRRYSFPSYSKNARRPNKNKPLLILCRLLDEIEACFEVFSLSHNIAVSYFSFGIYSIPCFWLSRLVFLLSRKN